MIGRGAAGPLACLLALTCGLGCASAPEPVAQRRAFPAAEEEDEPRYFPLRGGESYAGRAAPGQPVVAARPPRGGHVRQASYAQDDAAPADAPPAEAPMTGGRHVAPQPAAVPAVPPAPAGPPAVTPLAGVGTLTLEEVLQSVQTNYPLLRSAFEARRITAGDQLAAWGNFDTNLDASAVSQPLGDYENHRFGVGVEQPTYWGGKVSTGYRIGRGEFEPWYLERETDEGGEFNVGLSVPFGQGRDIDYRRADLWRSTYGRAGVEFDIQADQIDFTRAATLAYGDWVASGEVYRVSEALLRLAQSRVESLEEQVREERIARIALVDNRRLIVSREAKLIEARQKLQVNAIKLSLFLRAPDGTPIVPPADWLPPTLPVPEFVGALDVERDVAVALANRPELRQLDVDRRQLEVDLSLARNQVEPTIDGTLRASQDVGQDASTKSKGAIFEANNKDELTLEAGLFVEVPLQRRKGRGKMTAFEGKLAQNAAKRQFTENKIVADVQGADAALAAAYEQYRRATEAVRLNQELEDAERIRLAEGRSDLLLLNLREQATADARVSQVSAALNYFEAQAARRAALALDAAGAPPIPVAPAPPILPPPAPNGELP